MSKRVSRSRTSWELANLTIDVKSSGNSSIVKLICAYFLTFILSQKFKKLVN